MAALAVLSALGSSEAHVTNGHLYVGVFVNRAAPTSPVTVRAQDLNDSVKGQIKLGPVTVQVTCFDQASAYGILNQGHYYYGFGYRSSDHQPYAFSIGDTDVGADSLTLFSNARLLDAARCYSDNYTTRESFTGVGASVL